MGLESSKFNPDKYHSLEEVQKALRAEGLESSNLIFGVDYTGSNRETGRRTFGGRCLHDLTVKNPYEEVIEILGQTLEVFDDDRIIPSFGFGDKFTGDKSVFPFFPDKEPVGFQEVLNRYREITPGIELYGPTSFAPLIYKSIEIIRKNKSYHILVCLTDGQVSDRRVNADAIVYASQFPLSIVCVGVGDGPWDEMHRFDDNLPSRKFDNFQFVEFNEVKRKYGSNYVSAFAMSALMEIPPQFKYLKKHNMLNSV